MAKTRSFRLSGSNDLKLRELKEKLKIDNENATLNYIIESWNFVVIYKPACDRLKEIIDLMNNVKP